MVSLFTGDFTGAFNSIGSAFSSWVDGLKGLFFGFIGAIAIGFGVPIESLRAMLDTAMGLISPFVDAIGSLFSAVVSLFMGDWAGALDSLSDAFSAWIDGIGGLFGALFDGLADAWGGILGGIKAGVLSILPDWAIRLVGGDSSNGGGEAASGGQQMAVAAPAMTPNEAMAIGNTSNNTNNSTSNSNSSNTSNIEQQVQINVSSSDPKQAGAAVNDALQNQLRTAKTQVNRGGR